MAISFDETNDYISVTDVAGLTFPNGDWVIGFWIKVDDNTGTLYQYLFSNRNLGGNGSLNIYLNEASEATDANKWAFRAVDDLATDTGSLESSAVGADGKWRLLIVQRRTAASEIQLWFCEPFLTATKEIAGADTSFTSINGLSWNVGRRHDGDVNRYYGSLACEHFCGDFSLTQAQIELLGKGISPLRLARALGQTLKIYLPMWDATTEAVADLTDTGNDGTLNGIPAKAGSHAPVQLWFPPWPTLPTALAVIETILVGGTVTPAGALIKQPNLTTSGSVTPVGTLIKMCLKVLVGSITPTGSLLNNVIRALSVGGSITPAGSLVRQAQVIFIGSIASGGALADQVQHRLSGSITPAGSLVNLVQKIIAGAITPTSALVNVRIAIVVAAGVITPTGTLIRQVNKAATGAVETTGNLIKAVARNVSGMMSPAGALLKVWIGSFAGSTGLLGALTVEQVAGVVVSALKTLTLQARSLSLSVMSRTLNITLKDSRD